MSTTPKFNVDQCLQDCKQEAKYNSLKSEVKGLQPNEAKTKISSFLSTVKDADLKKQLQDTRSKDQLIQAIQKDLTQGHDYNRGATDRNSQPSHGGSQDYGRSQGGKDATRGKPPTR